MLVLQINVIDGGKYPIGLCFHHSKVQKYRMALGSGDITRIYQLGYCDTHSDINYMPIALLLLRSTRSMKMAVKMAQNVSFPSMHVYLSYLSLEDLCLWFS